ncbi:RNA-binding protein Cwf29 [Coemansia erecta]|uniref:RNA-binding protein Cwf29 n=1 Tax=Coemansia erecta TaxID=147472 RepID=A0A9W8CQK9_9FUNG|nr:RNA-binding protein Cwf29 [Coemansia erecta]
MNVVDEIRRINAREAQLGSGASGTSWHDEYKDSAYIFIGNLSFDLTEGDVICVFSQYGEVVNINLVRDSDTGVSKGYAFLQYEDQRSTVLAVDNLGGATVLGRTLRVDHVKNYRMPKSSAAAAAADAEGDGGDAPVERPMNAAPKPLEPLEPEEVEEDREDAMRSAGIDPEDPMAEYYFEKHLKAARKKRRKEEGSKKSKDKRRRHRREGAEPSAE